MPPPASAPGDPPRPRRRASTLVAIGKFISTNSSFFSSFVIGIAGLTATSIYQCNQSKLAERQAVSQATMAQLQADNNWKIERAKILSQNLQALTARGGDSAEQRYGVLLSLSRGNILDPDVSLSYALELGRDNPEYMRSVLTNIERKDEPYYQRLMAAYWVTCAQRYGVRSSEVETCKLDTLEPRSNTLAQVIADDLEAQFGSEALAGPMTLLRDDREVNTNLVKLSGLFLTFLQDVFERRQWKAITRFLAYSKGARLVGALVLSTQIGEAESNGDPEHEKVKELRKSLKEYFETFLLSGDCDHDCRSRILSVMLSNLGKGQGQFLQALRVLLSRPRVEVETLIARLNTRLMWCQIDQSDTLLLRDKVLLPVLGAQLAQPKPDPLMVEDLVELVALIPEPTEPSALWKASIDALTKFNGGRFLKLLGDRRATALQSRRIVEPPKPTTTNKTPAPAPAPAVVSTVKRHASFCHVAVEDRSDEGEEE